MLRNTIQHYLYHKEMEKQELSKLLSLLNKGIYILIFFNVVELVRQTYFFKYEFGLSFLFWGIVLMLIFYWMPNKKEYAEWKTLHSTF